MLWIEGKAGTECSATKIGGGGGAALTVRTVQGFPGVLASRLDAQRLYKAQTRVRWGRSSSTSRNRDGGLSSPPGGATRNTKGG